MDDENLFTEAAKGAKKLSHKKRVIPAAQPARAMIKQQRDSGSTAAQPYSIKQQASNLPFLTASDSARLDGKTAQKIQRGELPIQARLDLHGYRAENAHGALCEFAHHHYSNNKRMLLIITGKGSSIDNPEGVLKSSFPRWLNSPPLANITAYYSTAPAKLGGEGAFLLYLKRQKT